MKRTYGIVVFQEQVDQLLAEFAGYSPDEAEETREHIYKRRHESYVEGIKERVLSDISKRNFSDEVALHVYELVACFQGYGLRKGMPWRLPISQSAPSGASKTIPQSISQPCWTLNLQVITGLLRWRMKLGHVMLKSLAQM